MERVYAGSIRAFSVLLCVLGIALVASTIARGGGPFALGVLMGIGLTVFGAGRLYLTGRR